MCTRNRADSLARCLASIAADPSERAAELVVVDNGSTDSTPAVLSGATRESPRPLHVVRTSARGHSRARNAGIRSADGAILLFTDDDVVVQSGWIDALSAPFADAGVGAVGGRIVPTFLGKRPRWLTDDEVFLPVTLPDYGTQPFRFDDGRLPIGANMAIRAGLLDPDPFDPRLGHTGKLAIGFDEFFLLTRLARDHTVLYVPNAVVAHLLDDGRVTLARARQLVRGPSPQVGDSARKSSSPGCRHRSKDRSRSPSNPRRLTEPILRNAMARHQRRCVRVRPNMSRSL